MSEYYPVVYYALFYFLASKSFVRDGTAGLFGVVLAWFIFMFFLF